jgi:diguanylate cyclase (GGDEF)-like protein
MQSTKDQAGYHNYSGQASIGNLLAVVFLIGLIVTAILVYSAFIGYRVSAVRDMAQADAQRISHLVFEHLYSVMQKGATRAELDDLVHHIRVQLPNYEVVIVRGEPVVRQYGDRPGQAYLRQKDSDIADVIHSGQARSDTKGENLRHLFPVKVGAECTGCHSMARVGEVNGVISISVPMSSLEGPIAAIAHPIMLLTIGLLVVLVLVTFLVLRSRVSQPIADLTSHVSEMSDSVDYSRDLTVAPHWPKEVSSLALSFNQLMGQIRASNQQLLDISLRDPLTNLFNRRHFDSVLEQATVDARQGSLQFAVLLIDLDHFKPVNDRYGHAAGDAMLTGVAKALLGALRESDVAARIGGDEFAVLALATDAEQASELAERLRHAVSVPEFRFGHDVVRASCSIGVAGFPDSGELAADLLRAADTAMYVDKTRRSGGR